jgi:hypothetical protein
VKAECLKKFAQLEFKFSRWTNNFTSTTLFADSALEMFVKYNINNCPGLFFNNEVASWRFLLDTVNDNKRSKLETLFSV